MSKLKNFYENQLIQQFTMQDFNQQKVENLIEEYMTARIKDLMVKPAFA